MHSYTVRYKQIPSNDKSTQLGLSLSIFWNRDYSPLHPVQIRGVRNKLMTLHSLALLNCPLYFYLLVCHYSYTQLSFLCIYRTAFQNVIFSLFIFSYIIIIIKYYFYVYTLRIIIIYLFSQINYFVNYLAFTILIIR